MTETVPVPGTAASSDLQVFLRSLMIVGVAELFDKTWFMGLLLALKYPPGIVFIGSYVALFLHTILAAAFGLAFARLLSPRNLNFLAAGLFLFFAILYAKDWYFADPEGDAIAAGKADAEEDCEIDVGNEHDLLPTEAKDDSSSSQSDDQPSKAKGMQWTVLTKSFVGVFIAEWGDRTQFAMIGQHASQPLIPVFLGSCLAFFLLTASAVGAALVANDLKLSERTVHGVSAVCFAVFAVLALKDALGAASGDAAGVTA
mmetsp:Transcript_45537/g.134815  ORF Transcript_45537/g.134815 Transcript_45537/m.134815 type:complete len:258 (-) Transcript_45537:244-1017(-)